MTLNSSCKKGNVLVIVLISMLVIVSGFLFYFAKLAKTNKTDKNPANTTTMLPEIIYNSFEDPNWSTYTDHKSFLLQYPNNWLFFSAKDTGETDKNTFSLASGDITQPYTKKSLEITKVVVYIEPRTLAFDLYLKTIPELQNSINPNIQTARINGIEGRRFVSQEAGGYTAFYLPVGNNVLKIYGPIDNGAMDYDNFIKIVSSIKAEN